MTIALVKPGGWTQDIDILSANQANTLDAEQQKLLDGAAGGVYTPTSDIDLRIGSSTVNKQVHFKTGSSGKFPRLTLRHSSAVNVTDQTFGVTSGQIIRFVTPVGLKQHQMSVANAIAGDFIMFVSPATSVSNVEIHIAGSSPGYGVPGNVIVTLLNGFHAAAILHYDGAQWRLAASSPNVTVGPSA